MHAALLTPSKYIKAVEFKGKDVTLTIKGVKLEDLEKEDNTTERKGVVHFDETAKGWVINVTNCRSLVQMFGNETDNWVGKQVTLYPEVNDSSPDGLAIRVRGSPHLPADKSFMLKLARKKPKRMTLRKTPPRGGKPVAPVQMIEKAATPTEDSEPLEDAELDDVPPLGGDEGSGLDPLPDGQKL